MQFKIVLDKRYQRKNGTYSLKLRVYQGTGYKEKPAGISLNENDWDEVNQVVKDTCVNHQVYNAAILELKATTTKIILLESASSPIEVVRKPSTKRVSIVTYGRGQAAQFLNTGKVGNSIVYTTAINVLLRFTGTKDVFFDEINIAFLNKFQYSLQQRGVVLNTISFYFRTIRALFNKAMDEELITNYPFRKFKIKHEETENRVLSIAQMKSLINLQLEGEYDKWRRVFLISFCLRGINMCDLLVLTPRNVKQTRILYKRQKTGKKYSILLHPVTYNLMSNFKANHYLLPILTPTGDKMKLKNAVLNKTRLCNKFLKRIGKMINVPNLTTYYARYSFANIAKREGIPSDMISELLGHSGEVNTTTSIYLEKFDEYTLDQATKKIIEVVFNYNT